MPDRRDGCPPRPTSPAGLGFVPRKGMIRWYDPPVLAAGTLRTVVSKLFGPANDRRELQAALPAGDVFDLTAQDEVWLDYVADLGEGFDATYTIAWLLAQDHLRLPGHGDPLPRGQVLVMGGDEVYPTPSAPRYENQTVGPYRAALPCAPADRAPALFAVPGKHDWYDGLTSFLRLFCQRQWVGGWRTRQSRSYFAVALPHRWWLWGIDVQFEGYIDRPQLEYFASVARERLQGGDRVILCTPVPSWARPDRSARAQRNLDYFERTVVTPAGATVAVHLAGDLHHYCHYRSPDGAQHRFTAGGGGAFLHPTHLLGARVALPGPGPDTRVLERVGCFPDARTSRRLTWRNLGFAARNPWFALSLGGLDLALAWVVQSSERRPGEGVAPSVARLGPGPLTTGVARSPAALLLVAAVVAGFTLFAKPRRPGRRSEWVVGAVHGALHVAVAVLVIVAAAPLASGVAGGGGWGAAAFAAVVVAAGSVAGGTLTGAYLVAASLVAGMHENEAFSSLRIADYKSFLRLHLDRSGRLTVYPVGVRRVPRRWKLRPEADVGAPWFEPAVPVRPELVDGPVRIGPAPTRRRRRGARS